MTRDPQVSPPTPIASPTPTPRRRPRLHGVTVAVVLAGALTTTWFATRPHPPALGKSGTVFMAFEPVRRLLIASLGVAATFAAATAMECFARRMDA
ncbi:MAG: hypothetical protein L6R28_11635 [Planctomycetes bacterium]|nr:hypothetical protein [Planctomycetota bacterium]